MISSLRKTVTVILSLFCIATSFISCGFQNLNRDAGSVAFTIDSQFLQSLIFNKESRSADGAFNARVSKSEFYENLLDGGLYADISLEGTYSAKKTVYIHLRMEDIFSGGLSPFENDFADVEPVNIKFEGIPSGAKVRAKVIFYPVQIVSEGENGEPVCEKDESNGFLYIAKSDYVTIKSGLNVIEMFVLDGDIKIYVNCSSSSSSSSSSTIIDGKSLETAFTDIASAVEYVKNSRETERPYRIILDNSNGSFYIENYERIVEIKDLGKKTIIFSSVNPETKAIEINGYTTHACFSIDSENTSILFEDIIINQHNSNFNGPVMVIENGNVFLKRNCVIDGSGNDDGNYNGNSGGAIQLACGKLEMLSNSKIQNFSSTVQGGAVLVGRSGEFVLKDDAEISYCTSVQGGAFYVFGGTVRMEGNSRISNCSVARTVNYNESDHGTGGAFYVTNANSHVYLFENASIEHCTAQNGGAVYLSETNSLPSEEESTLLINDNATITGCSVSKAETADSLTGNGGAIYIDFRSTAGIQGGKISSCSAETAGSALYIANGGICRASEGIIEGNSTENGVTGTGAYITGTMNLSGNILFASDDDLYVADSNSVKINIAGDLTQYKTASISAADLSLYENSYSLFTTENENEELKKYCTSFYINDFAGNEYYLTEEGHIANFTNYVLSDGGSPLEAGDVILKNKSIIKAQNAKYITKNYLAEAVGVFCGEVAANELFDSSSEEKLIVYKDDNMSYGSSYELIPYVPANQGEYHIYYQDFQIKDYSKNMPVTGVNYERQYNSAVYPDYDTITEPCSLSFAGEIREQFTGSNFINWELPKTYQLIKLYENKDIVSESLACLNSSFSKNILEKSYWTNVNIASLATGATNECYCIDFAKGTVFGTSYKGVKGPNTCLIHVWE